MSERFLQAASSGETAVVASMLRNPDLDSPGKRALLEATTPQGHCALHVAALNGHAGVVNMLLKEGADRDMKTRFGKTPLACAESANHHEVIKLLTPEKATFRERHGLRIPSFRKKKEVATPETPPAAPAPAARAPARSMSPPPGQSDDEDGAWDSDEEGDGGKAANLMALAGAESERMRAPPVAKSLADRRFSASFLTPAKKDRKNSFSGGSGPCGASPGGARSGGTVPQSFNCGRRCSTSCGAPGGSFRSGGGRRCSLDEGTIQRAAKLGEELRRAPDEVAAQLAACSAGVLGGGASSSSSMLPPDLFPTTQAVNVRLSVGTSALVSTVGPEDGQDLSLPPTKGRGRSREDFVPDGI